MSRLRPLIALLVWTSIRPFPLHAEPLAVRYREGLVHGFLVLSTLEGKVLAAGDLYQVPRGDLVTARLVFRFHDGSVHEETTVFSQRRTFRLVSYRLVQKGPAFKLPMDLTIDPGKGDVTVRTTDGDGKERVINEHMDLPDDLANGLPSVLMKNVKPGTPQTTLPLLVTTPKPRLVKLVITPSGKASFAFAGSPHRATDYLIKVEIGGLTEVLAELLGKAPPDAHLWVLGGEAPAFVKSEAPLSMGGPVLRVELAGPVFPKPKAPRKPL